MRVLITGGAGFVGSHLVDHYLRRGDEVIVIDNLITGQEENVRQHIDNKKLKFIKQDVCDVAEVKGNVDLKKLQAFIDEFGLEKIAFVNVEMNVNMAGGQPISMQSLKELREFSIRNANLNTIDGNYKNCRRNQKKCVVPLYFLI